MRRLLWVGLLFLALVAPVGGGGLIIVEDPGLWDGGDGRRVPPPPRVLPHPPPQPWPPVWRWAPLEVSSTRVSVKIVDQVATTEVEQEFYNPHGRRLEGTFLFPVPKGAQIDRFQMEINGKRVEAELLEAEKARGIYEEIVRTLKDPALLEYSGRDLFKARIFPIEPHGRKRVVLRYSEVLPADTGLVGYRFPLNTEKYSAKPVRNLSLKVELEAGRGLTSIYSPSHAVEIRKHGDDKATVGFEAVDLKPDLDFQLFFAREEGEFGLNLLTRKLEGEEGYFLLLVSPGAELKGARPSEKDIVFVLDTSGSMAGEKLAQAKKALLFCVENLNEGDRFDVLRFSTEVEPLFDELRGAGEAARLRASEFIREMKPIGGTAIDAALQRALSIRPKEGGRPYVVVFLTDGRPTVGRTDPELIVRGVSGEKRGGARIFCFGIGTDVNTHLLDRITEETKAFSQYVLEEEDLELKVSSFYTKIKEPVLSDLQLVFPEGVKAARLYPSPLPDLFKGQQLVVAGRYSGRVDGRMEIRGKSGGEDRVFSYESRFPAESAGHEFIPRLWATRRVGYLLDEMRLHGENRELREEITELARTYGIVTPFTSYLIVEDERRRDVPAASRSLQPAGDVQGRAYSTFLRAEEGESAVAGARSSYLLKSAVTSSDAISAGNEAVRKLAGPVDSRGGDGPGEVTESRYVGGRTFYRNGGRWVDAGISRLAEARRIELLFGSDAYFDFVRKNPGAVTWISLGRDVDLNLDGVVYEIRGAGE